MRGHTEVKTELKKNEISTLSEEIARLLDRTYNDLMSTLVNLSGSLKDIECGTRIKIPIPAGYVNFYKSTESFEMSLWLKENMMETEPMTQENLNLNDEA